MGYWGWIRVGIRVGSIAGSDDATTHRAGGEQPIPSRHAATKKNFTSTSSNFLPNNHSTVPYATQPVSLQPLILLPVSPTPRLFYLIPIFASHEPLFSATSITQPAKFPPTHVRTSQSCLPNPPNHAGRKYFFKRTTIYRHPNYRTCQPVSRNGAN